MNFIVPHLFRPVPASGGGRGPLERRVLPLVLIGLEPEVRADGRDVLLPVSLVGIFLGSACGTYQGTI